MRCIDRRAYSFGMAHVNARVPAGIGLNVRTPVCRSSGIALTRCAAKSAMSRTADVSKADTSRGSCSFTESSASVIAGVRPSQFVPDAPGSSNSAILPSFNAVNTPCGLKQVDRPSKE